MGEGGEADPQNNTRHGQVLEKVSKAKYLGVELTEGLNWSTRIQATIAEPKMGPLVHALQTKRPPNHNPNEFATRGIVQPNMKYVATV